MNKRIIASCLLFVPFLAAADSNFDASYPSSKAKSVTYKVTIYRDDSYDEQTWEKLVTDAATAIKCASEYQDNSNAATGEIVNAFVRAMQEIYTLNTDEIEGIHGQMSIEVADNFEDDMAATDLDQE